MTQSGLNTKVETMSHVTLVEGIRIRDLDALEFAAKRIGMELVRDQKEFRWFGEHVGDFPLPAGFTKDDMGQCEHALRVSGNPKAYEVGVVKARDAEGGYMLMWDFWAGDQGLRDVVGDGCQELVDNYVSVAAKRQLVSDGFNLVSETALEGGGRQLVMEI